MRGTSLSFLLWTLLAGLVAFLVVWARTSSPKRSSAKVDDQILASLRRDFLTKVSHNKLAANRIINRLREKHPREPLTSIYQRAI